MIKTILVALAAIVGLAGCGTFSSTSKHDIPEQVVDWAQQNVWAVAVRGGSGSGFWITDKTFVTACHVVYREYAEDGISALVQLDSTELIPMKIDTCNVDTDIATMSKLFDDTEFFADPTEILYPQDLKQGKAVWGPGFPLGKEMVVTTGHLQNQVGQDPFWIITAPTIFGDSGSPAVTIVNGRVAVIGIRVSIAAARVSWTQSVPVTHLTRISSIENVIDEIHKDL